MIDINSFANFFLEPGWFQAFLYIWQNLIRYSVLILDAVLILGIFFIFLKIYPLLYKMRLYDWPTIRSAGQKMRKDKKFVRQWQKIKDKLTNPTPENLKIAVIEADAMVDTFLKKSGYTGEHMADRLSHIASSEVRSIKGVWDAHLLRNSLVHVPGSNVSTAVSKAAVNAFENFLKELGAI